MRTLKDILAESVLDDVEVTLQAGDEHAAIIAQLNKIQKAIKTGASSWKTVSNDRYDGTKNINKETEHFYNCKELIDYLGGPDDACWISIEYNIVSYRGAIGTNNYMKAYLNFGTDMREILSQRELKIQGAKYYSYDWEPKSETEGRKDLVTKFKACSVEELKARIQ